MTDNQVQLEQKLKEVTNLELKLRLIAISHLVDKRKQLDKDQEKEVREIEKKYNAVFVPLLTQTNEIINAERPITSEESAQLDQYLNENEKANKETYLKNTDPINSYWLKALKNQQSVKHDLGPKDDAILQHLKKIESEGDVLNDNFTLTFTFEENPHFTNDVIKVKFHVGEDQEPLRVESTVINWKEGKNITRKVIKKKKNKKIKVKEVEQETFFHLFRNIDSTSEEFKASTTEQKEESTYKLTIAYEIGSLIYNEVIPYSLEYYLGVRVQEDDGQEDDDEEEVEDFSDDEEITKEEAIKRLKARHKGGKK